jgi:predicted permease
MTHIKSAARALRHGVGFTLVATATLAVAIGATTAIFSVYDQLILHPVSIRDAGSLVAIWFNNPKRNTQTPSISIPRYDELKAAVRSYTSVALSAFDSFTLTGAGDAAQLNGLRVSARFFPTLGVMPARGRNFTDAEDLPNGPAVCILSHEAWQTLFGARASIVGETITLNGLSWQVVGIMPPALTAPFRQVQIFAPRVFETGGLTPAQVQAGATFAQPIARLKPGVTLEQARAELIAFSAAYKARYPGNIDADNVSEPRSFVSTLTSGFEPSMNALLGGVTLVLLIACANVGSLYLSRLVRRRKEVATRIALGASRAAIVQQFLTEALFVSSTAGAAGIVLAAWGLQALQTIAATQLPPNTTLALNWRALLFGVAASTLTSALIALVPALQVSRPDVVEQLKDTPRGSTSGHGARSRRVLVLAEVMLSVVLLVGSVLLLVSFIRLQNAPLGFQSHGRAAAFVALPARTYATPQQQADFFDRAVAALRAEPGVNAAAAAWTIPLTGSARTTYGIAGQPLPPPAQRPIVSLNVVSTDFSGTMGIPLAAGRPFGGDDRAAAPPVCIINESFARRIFAGRSALGEGLLLGAQTKRVEIVGVIDDVRSAGANAPVPDELYVPLAQLPRSGLNLVARTEGDPQLLQAAMRSAVRRVDPNVAISFFATLDTNLMQTIGPQKLVATLTAIFAILALILSLTGVYSVLAYLVTQRTGEIGVRMALGATPGHVLMLMMRSGLGPVAAGVALGLALSAGGTLLMRQLLFAIEPFSAPVYAAVGVTFVAVSAAACLMPALRASRIDPLLAFRND